MTSPTESKFAVLRPDQIAAHDRGGGARTTPLHLANQQYVYPTPLGSRSGGATTFINGITEFAPGARIPFHSHNCEESVMLLAGRAVLDIDSEVHELKPFDTTFIPPDVPHRFRNISETEAMKILWIYASPAATRTVVETGETRPISAEHAG